LSTNLNNLTLPGVLLDLLINDEIIPIREYYCSKLPKRLVFKQMTPLELSHTSQVLRNTQQHQELPLTRVYTTEGVYKTFQVTRELTCNDIIFKLSQKLELTEQGLAKRPGLFLVTNDRGRHQKSSN
jgi:hypothetical protein